MKDEDEMKSAHNTESDKQWIEKSENILTDFSF